MFNVNAHRNFENWYITAILRSVPSVLDEDMIMMPWVVTTDDTRHLEAQAHLYSVGVASSCLSQPEPRTVGSSNYVCHSLVESIFYVPVLLE